MLRNTNFEGALITNKLSYWSDLKEIEQLKGVQSG